MELKEGNKGDPGGISQPGFLQVLLVLCPCTEYYNRKLEWCEGKWRSCDWGT